MVELGVWVAGHLCRWDTAVYNRDESNRTCVQMLLGSQVDT